MSFTSVQRPAAAGAPSPWFMIEGAVLIVLGVLALILPFTAGVFAGVMLGWALVVSGVVGLLATWRGQGHLHASWSLVSGVVAILAGLLIAFNPLVGAVAVVFLVAAYLAVDGVAHIGLALDHRRRAVRRWGWMLAIGVGDLLLALLVLALGPVGASVLVGLIVGVDLILGGLVLIGLGRRDPAVATTI